MAGHGIFRRRPFRARRLPEVTKGRLEDAGAWAHKIDSTEFRVSNVEHARQLAPVGDICWCKDSPRSTFSGMCFYDLLCIGSESEIREDYIAAFREKKGCKFEVYACVLLNVVAVKYIRVVSRRCTGAGARNYGAFAFYSKCWYT